MIPSVGFTILSHGNPDQLKRLVGALDREFGQPAIACHHDFGQAPLNPSEFGGNVRFVQPHIATGWGRFSVVRAQLAALKLLYSKPTDWFFHLSAADYPVMPGREVRRLLGGAKCDAFLDAHAIGDVKARAATIGQPSPKLSHFDSPGNQRLKAKFYTAYEIWLPMLRRDPKWRLGRHTIRLGKVGGLVPTFYGDHWFGGNAKVAEVLLNPTEEHLALQKHLAHRTQTDETYFQTVLMNEPGLTVCLDNKRFAEWNGGGAHPMAMGERQVKEALGSGAFFARKFEHGSPVLDMVDRALLGAV